MFRKLIDIFKGSVGFAYVSVAGMVNSIAGALFYLFFATFLSVDDYGKINYMVSSGMVAFILCTSGMDVVIMSYFSKRHSILFEISSLALVTSVIGAILVSILLNNFAIGLMIVGSSLYFISYSELLARKLYKRFFWINVGGRVSQIFLSLIFYYLFGVEGFILGYAVAHSLFGYKSILNIRKFRLEFRELKSIWKYILHLYGANASYLLMSYLDKIVIGVLFGYYVLGTYQLAFQVFMFISFFPTSVFNYLLPHEVGGTIKRNFKIWGLLAAILISFITILAAPYLVYSFFPKYVHAIESIRIITLCVIPLTLINIQKTKIISQEKKLIHILTSSIVTLATQNLLVAPLGSMFGVLGLSISLLVALCVQCLYLYIVNRRKIF